MALVKFVDNFTSNLNVGRGESHLLCHPTAN